MERKGSPLPEKRDIVKHLCRQLRTGHLHRRQSLQKFLPHARLITDPKKLAQLNADVALRRREEHERLTGSSPIIR
jgi:hypothetical protein